MNKSGISVCFSIEFIQPDQWVKQLDLCQRTTEKTAKDSQFGHPWSCIACMYLRCERRSLTACTIRDKPAVLRCCPVLNVPVLDFFPPSSLLRTMTLVRLDPQEDITPSIVTLKNHSRKKPRAKKLQVLLNNFWS